MAWLFQIILCTKCALGIIAYALRPAYASKSLHRKIFSITTWNVHSDHYRSQELKKTV
jgi:hypothetical protein